MTKTTTKTRNAIVRYTREGCLRAFRLHEAGISMNHIYFVHGIPGVTSNAGANAAVNAGREITEADSSNNRPDPEPGYGAWLYE